MYFRTKSNYMIEDNIQRENREQRRKEETDKLKKSPEYIQSNINHFTRQKEILEKKLANATTIEAKYRVEKKS